MSSQARLEVAEPVGDRRSKVEVRNRFDVLEVEEEDEEDIGEVVEVTMDSGAARSVWPRRKKGVKRQKIQGKKPKLAAANGTCIEVDGEALLEFKMSGRRCGMKFLDADVKKPLGAVSAMVDEGNTVVFSRKWGCFVENDVTSERIPMSRKGGTYVMMLEGVVDLKAKQKKTAGGDMEVNGTEEEAAKDDTGVFRRRAQ